MRMFQGRLNRKDFLKGVLASFVLCQILALAISIPIVPSLGDNSIWWIVTFVNTLFLLHLASLSVRRFHDFDRGGKVSVVFAVLASLFLFLMVFSGLLFSMSGYFQKSSLFGLFFGFTFNISLILGVMVFGQAAFYSGNPVTNHYGAPTNHGWRLGTILFGKERR